MKTQAQLGTLVIAAALVVPAMAYQPPQNNGGQKQGQSRSAGKQSQGSGPHAGDWLRRNMNTPPAQQKKELESSDDFKRLPPDRQQQLLNRLNRFNALSPEKKNRMLSHMEWLERLSPEQKQKADNLHTQFRSLTPERRIAVRNALYNMRDLNQDDRQKQIDSQQMKKDFSDQERQIMKGYTDLGFPDEHAEFGGGSPQEDM